MKGIQTTARLVNSVSQKRDCVGRERGWRSGRDERGIEDVDAIDDSDRWKEVWMVRMLMRG